MHTTYKSQLGRRKHYLQIALNNTLEEARKIIFSLPISDRILIEAGTPFVKRYGEEGIHKIVRWWSSQQKENPYVVADLKTMDRGTTEVEMAARAGARAITALGSAPKETLDAFIEACGKFSMDAMIDMMNVEFPLNVLRSLKKLPQVVILHRGVDEEEFNREKQIPLHEIRRIKGNYDMLISVAGGDTPREVQSSIFNDADIVVIWKSVFQHTDETLNIVENFLKEIK